MDSVPRLVRCSIVNSQVSRFALFLVLIAALNELVSNVLPLSLRTWLVSSKIKLARQDRTYASVVVIPDLVHDVVEAAAFQSVPYPHLSEVEAFLHLPSKTGGENGREHQVVGGE